MLLPPRKKSFVNIGLFVHDVDPEVQKHHDRIFPRGFDVQDMSPQLPQREAEIEKTVQQLSRSI